MRKLKLIFAISVIVAAVACSSNKTESKATAFNFDTTSLKAGEVYYQCPMHPAVVSSKPGDCPECAMALEPMTKQ